MKRIYFVMINIMNADDNDDDDVNNDNDDYAHIIT